MTKDVESPNYRYGKWGFDKKGVKQNPENCVAELYGGRGAACQCLNKRKYGLYCGVHRRAEKGSVAQE
jgi:hypothetical protein